MSPVLERYADRYSPHWQRVHTELLGIDPQTLDGEFHDAPCCGAKGKFKASDTAGGLVLLCHGCGGGDGAGGPLANIDLVAKRLGVSRNDAWQRVNAFLGFASTLTEHLLTLPSDWRLVRVGRDKAPIAGTGWFDVDDYSPDDAASLNGSGPPAWGLKCGPVSGGILVLDLDSPGWEIALQEVTGHPHTDLPRTIAWTSGKPGRSGRAFQVDPDWWEHLDNRRAFTRPWRDGDPLSKSGKRSAITTFELRWDRCQSVVLGAHPETDGYRWLPGCSPEDIPDPAPAPDWLLEPLLVQEHPDAPAVTPTAEDAERALAMLQCLPPEDYSAYSDWLRIGMALHHTDDGLLSAWVDWCRGMAAFDEAECLRKWDSFGKASQRGRPATIATLHHLAKQHGYKAPKRKREQAPTRKAAPLALPDEGDGPSRPKKIEAADLLTLLRGKARNGGIRFNQYSKQIEVNGEVLEGAERFYLTLAEEGYKASKELALDCLVQVANENPYDPVRLYLEHVEATVAPGYIDRLATAYLRPTDSSSDAPTLYDHMLRCTLIGAVRRAFEPGCKHDTACVLMGDQGAGKSSFWGALGGPFFSDALGDISSKDDLMILHRSWIMEWAELDHVTGRKHAGQVKSFLSQSTDLFRVPYGKATEAFPRRGIIVGSTNRSTGFLVDETGNRRFWVIPTTCSMGQPINSAALVSERDAIWSAAVHAYRRGEANYLSSQWAEQVTKENEDYRIESPWLEAIEDWLNNPGNLLDPVTTERVLTAAIHKPLERLTRADQMTVADILRSLGWERKRGRSDGERGYFWKKTPSGVPTSL